MLVLVLVGRGRGTAIFHPRQPGKTAMQTSTHSCSTSRGVCMYGTSTGQACDESVSL